MTPFGRSRQRDDEDARGEANGGGGVPEQTPEAPTTPAAIPPPASPRFPAPAPRPRESAGDPGPWGPVGGASAVNTPPHGTPRPDFVRPEPATDRIPPVAEPPVREPLEPDPEPVAAAPADAGIPPGRTFRGPLESALRHPFLTIIPVIVLVGIAAAIGISRDPTYTGSSRINVGRVDVPAYTLQGVIIGNATLASGYARLIDAEPVAGPAGNAVGLSPDQARDRLSASPVPGSTLIRVEADGPNQKDAVRLSNAGARSLINYVEDLNRQQQTSGLLRQFRAARAKVERSKSTLQRLLVNPRPSRARVEKARLDLASAQLQSDTIGNQYRAVQGGPDAQNMLQFVAPAAQATSDRRSTFERLLLIGLAAGVLVGLALALLRENSHLIGRKST